MIILGIDPGFERLGCAVLEKSPALRDKLIYSVCLTTDKKLSYEKRLFYLGKEVKKIILKYKPDILAIEKLFFTKNQKTGLRVAEARGMILYISSLKNIPIIEFTPLEIKIAITGYGKANKTQMQKMIKAILKIPVPKSDDEADAIATAITCSSRYPKKSYPQKNF
jgi:crossover junction endodeoxyribonuclease RuvC